MTLSEVTGIAGEAGNFQVTVKEHPRYVDMDKCIACGECTTKCPKKVPSEYDAATGKRKAIYVKYAQAVAAQVSDRPGKLYPAEQAWCLRVLRKSLSRRCGQFR